MVDDIIVAAAIPYKNHKDKFKLVSQELMKNRYVEVVDELKMIYSERKVKDGESIPSIRG